MVALAEELLVTSLLELLVSAIEMTLSLRPNTIGSETRIARMARGFFDSTTSKFNYTRRYRVNTNFLREIVPSDTLFCLVTKSSVNF